MRQLCRSSSFSRRNLCLSHQTLVIPVEELKRGTTFANRYEIIEELGKGGMGRVYKVHDTEIKEKVALKLIKPEIAADKKTIERFQNELKFARKVSHRNVCRMYDLNKEEGSYYITMEYVSGEDLRKISEESGVSHIWQASLSKVKDQFRIDYSKHDAKKRLSFLHSQ